ncbi:MAG: galactose-1-phosphate uridylyltransferase [Clostridiales bacterium]|jgi:UDPglucose--hexose-1-phosphate uridylyltransferase|nr:galactose-1-phosphate uridylyltransferase [Clostridiales bacterium]
MAELRFNPISREWVMVASHRQARPQMPKDWCPFCPGSGRVPDGGFDVLRYPNDFPALSQAPPAPDDVAGPLFQVKPAYGRCDVLLYSDRHTATLAAMPDAHARKIARMWRECYVDFAADPKIEYVFLFENRGEPVGVTMPHPHGQAYGYSYIPAKIQAELDGAAAYAAERGGACIYCDLLAEERRDGRRVVFENAFFTAYVPFFSPITYGIHVTARRHVRHIAEMSGEELDALGETVRDCAGMYDALFDAAFPYMMCMYNAPTPGAGGQQGVQQGAGGQQGGQPSAGGQQGGGGCCASHFHIKFYPPMRAADKQQFFASSETGAGAWCNPSCPEEKAGELRAAHARFMRARQGSAGG